MLKSKRLGVILALISLIGSIAYMYTPLQPTMPTQTRYVKINVKGEELSAWEGPWQCVHDKEHNLIWEVKSYIEDIHDLQCSFSWFNGELGVANKGSCFTDDLHSDTLEIVSLANAQKRCGIDTWRLPTTKELQSLLTMTAKPGEPLIDGDYFPYTKNQPYWTSESQMPLKGHFKYLKYGATAIHFKTGKSVALPYKSAGFVRLVSGKK